MPLTTPSPSSKPEAAVTINFRKALKLYEIRHKDQFIKKLMANFNIAQSAKFIQIFSGEQIKIPLKEDVWMMYRNQQIRIALDKVDPDDRLAQRIERMRLSVFWDCSYPRVGAIYAEEQALLPKGFDSVDKMAFKIYHEEFVHFQEELEAFFGSEERGKNTQTSRKMVIW